MKNSPVSRSGRIIRQPEGYRAFIPEPLPPTPPIRMDDEMLDLLSKADRALGRLDGSIETIPNPDLFVFMYVRKEAVLSSQIEGTQASLEDLLVYEAKARETQAPVDIEEVSNYVEAMRYGLKRLETLPVSLKLIREIHEKLLTGVRGGNRAPGEFRTSQNWVGPAGCNLETATHVPPPPHDMMKAMGDLEGFIHSKAPMPILIKVALIHAQFETVHPFLDGNGRVGRLLITFLLCEEGILKQPLLYLSIFFKKNRQEYYDRLQATRNAGDWENWVKFFLRGVYEVSQEATSTARRILHLREEHRSIILQQARLNSAKTLLLLEGLYRKPFMSMPEMSSLMDISFQTANRIAGDLLKIGILKEVTGLRRNRVFEYAPYTALFKEEQST